MSPHQVYIANDIAYVVARNGDTFKDLGNEFDISWKKLVKYNDLQRDYTLMEGDIIYLKSKKKKGFQTLYCICCERWRFHAWHLSKIWYPPQKSV
mgnify:FL=1